MNERIPIDGLTIDTERTPSGYFHVRCPDGTSIVAFGNYAELRDHGVTIPDPPAPEPEWVDVTIPNGSKVRVRRGTTPAPAPEPERRLLRLALDSYEWVLAAPSAGDLRPGDVVGGLEVARKPRITNMMSGHQWRVDYTEGTFSKHALATPVVLDKVADRG